MGARLTTELSAKGVKIRPLRDKAPSTRLPLQLSVGAVDNGTGRLLSTVLRRVRVNVGEFGRCAAAAAQVPFEGYAFFFPE